MKYLIIFALTFSCATTKKLTQKRYEVQNDINKVQSYSVGTLLTINLNTEDRIKRGNRCFLYFSTRSKQYKILLKEGLINYFIPSLNEKLHIDEINCGLFYYYKLKDNITSLDAKLDKINYLGQIDFELQDKGNLHWGIPSKDISFTNSRLNEIGIPINNVVTHKLNIIKEGQ